MTREPARNPVRLVLVPLILGLIVPNGALAHGWIPPKPPPPPWVPPGVMDPRPSPVVPVRPTGATPPPLIGGGATPRPAGRGTTPSRRSKKSGGGDRWDLWWQYNRDAFLNLKARLGARDAFSGSADWLLGRGDRASLVPALRPTARKVRREVVPALLAALEDPFYDVRASSALALGKISDPRALGGLVRTLADTHRKVSESAALAIGILGDPLGAPVLRELLRDTPSGRAFAGRPAGVPARTRAFAAIGLGRIGAAGAAEELLAFVEHPGRVASLDLPVTAAAALGLLGEQGRPAVLPLARILRDPRADRRLRGTAAVSLGRIGDPEGLPHLRWALRESDLVVRRSAVLALGRIAGPDNRTSAEMLSRLVEKGSDLVARGWSCIALGRIGGPVAYRTLARTVAGEHGSVQSYAAIGLGILLAGSPTHTDEGGLEILRSGFLRTRNESIRAAFALALGIAGARSSEADLAGSLAERHSEGLRGFSAVALGLMGSTPAIPRLREMVREERSPFVQQRAATALGLLGDRRAVSLLTETLRDAKTDFLRGSAAHALGLIGDASSIEILTRLVLDRGITPDMTRSMAAVALGILGEPVPVPAVSALAEDGNYLSAVEAILEAIRIG